MIAIYLRYSSKLQDGSLTFEFQESACRSFIKREAYAGKIAVYKDRAESGRSFFRPGYMRLIEDMEKGLVARVIFYRYDRFGRSMLEALLRINALESRGVQCLSATEPNDPTSRGFALLMAQHESETIGKRTSAARREAVKKGLWVGGKVYGYDLLKQVKYNKLETNPCEAAVVVRIWTLYSNGMGPISIAHLLNEEGIPGPRGSGWDFNEVEFILRNKLHYGVMEYGKWKYTLDPVTGKRRRKAADPESIIRVALPDARIVDEELERRVAARLQERASISKKRGPGAVRRRTHLLSGKIECGECADGHYTAWGERFRCNRHVRRGDAVCSNGQTFPIEQLERAVLDGIEEGLLSAKGLDDLARLVEKELGRAAKTADLRGKRLADVERRIASLVRALEGEREKPESVLGRIRELEEEKERLAAESREAEKVKPASWSRERVVEAVRERVGDIWALYRRVKEKGGDAAVEFAAAARGVIKGLTAYRDGNVLVRVDPTGLLPAGIAAKVIWNFAPTLMTTLPFTFSEPRSLE